MLRILSIEELQSISMQIPLLISLFEKKESQFFNSVIAWLELLEKVLENNRMKACSDIAILKGSLLAVERGLVPKDMAIARNKSHRKIMDLAAVDTLKEANELINNLLKGPLAQINEAERLMRQILPLAEKKGLVYQVDNPSDHSMLLHKIWVQIQNDPELAAVALHIKGLVGNNDSFIILDRALSSD